MTERSRQILAKTRALLHPARCRTALWCVDRVKPSNRKLNGCSEVTSLLHEPTAVDFVTGPTAQSAPASPGTGFGTEQEAASSHFEATHPDAAAWATAKASRTSKSRIASMIP